MAGVTLSPVGQVLARSTGPSWAKLSSATDRMISGVTRSIPCGDRADLRSFVERDQVLRDPLVGALGNPLDQSGVASGVLRTYRSFPGSCLLEYALSRGAVREPQKRT